jgi:hypothetical protein
MFPMGYDHDLTLVRAEPGEALPDMISIPDCAVPATRFATPAEILGTGHSQPVKAFCPYYNSMYTIYELAAGNTLTLDAHTALIAGTQYLWEKEHTSKAYLWRTDPDDITLVGGSGGAVLIGETTAATCLVGMFQNFETHIKKNKGWIGKFPLDRDILLLGTYEKQAKYRGGFVLPADIQESTIVLSDRIANPARTRSKTDALKSDPGEGSSSRPGHSRNDSKTDPTH